MISDQGINLNPSDKVKYVRFINVFPLGLSLRSQLIFLQRFFSKKKVLLTVLLIKRAFYRKSLDFNTNLKQQQSLLKYPTVSLKSFNIAICITQNQ